MSRRKLPRRFAASISTVAAALAAFLALWAGADAAWAQDQTPRARTVVGGGRQQQACVRAVQAGQADEAAVALCTRALETLAENGGARLDRLSLLINRGVTLLRLREGERALADFDAALAIEPAHPEALLNRGAVLVMLNRPGPAVAALTAALSHGVSTPHKAYYNRGAAREALGDMRGAYEDYTTALEINPNWAPAEAEVARFVRGRQARLAAVLAEDEAQGRN
jgi:tetratricopeptide (TPR) repeat protein